MAKKDSINYQYLLQEINSGNISPVYFLYGEEEYYIDIISQSLIDIVLNEDERDFNERVLFGNETDVRSVICELRYFPTFADKRLVVVKEAQLLEKERGKLDDLIGYFENHQPTTVLVLCYKKKFEGKVGFIKAVTKCGGIAFESSKLYDNEVADWIKSYLLSKKIAVEGHGAQMLAEYIGNDLSRIVGEVNKLLIGLPKDRRTITLSDIEAVVGISKEFNVFELVKAVAVKDFYKANFIASNLKKNPKANPSTITLSSLFNHFSKLLLAHYLPNKTEAALKSEMGLNYFQAKDMMVSLQRYSAGKTIAIIRLIRQFDARYKGFRTTAQDEGELLIELIYKMMVNV